MKAFLLSASLFASAIAAAAQTPVPIAVPEQFASAQTAFLAAGAAPALGAKEKLVTAMIYDSMYRGLSSGNQYRLLARPASAELCMEISVVISAGSFNNLPNAIVLRLSVRDTKTQTLLWNVDEPLEGAFREKTFQKNVDEATSKIVTDLKALAAGKEPQ